MAAAALGALLYTVVTSDAVESALSGIFELGKQSARLSAEHNWRG